MLLGHRKGLAVLFLTEMWERYSFYALRALLVLYLTARASEGGLGWGTADAIRLVGIYLGAAYITPIIGGYVSDYYLGQRRCAMIGALMMAAGHFCMAFSNIYIFYAALSLVALGNGFFKPCLTSILGQMYDDADESQRDSAYSLFYMGVNIGGALAGILSGVLMQSYGFHAAFTSAGVGMLVATFIFWYGKDRYLDDAGIEPTVKRVDDHTAPLTSQEKSRLGLIVLLFALTIGFFVAWEQLSGAVTMFIQGSVNRRIGGYDIPTTWLANLNPIMIIVMAPTLSAIWAYLGERGMDPFLGVKIGLGFIFMAISFIILQQMTTFDQPHWGWIVVNQFLVVLGELCIVPISWAAVSALAPKSYLSRAMALMLAGIGVGSYLAGYFGSWVTEIGEHTLFGAMAILSTVLGLFSVLLNKRMWKLSHGVVQK